MSIVVVTGSSGLIGSETVTYYCGKGYEVWGLDNNMRQYFFGEDASTDWNRNELLRQHRNFTHHNIDIRDLEALQELFRRGKKDIALVLHSAAQPSHDWAAKEPHTDFSVNATGTLNLLECVRQHCPDAAFIFTSTNKVYGDNPNNLDFVELPTRYELPVGHALFNGLDEKFPIDQCLHSLFGASKLAADVLVQEYGRYFGMNTGVFRGGCLTGGRHAGTMLHGFLSYLIKCAIVGREYTVIGYAGKQVRDNIHSIDLINAFDQFFQKPRQGAVYNIGGTRQSNCSILEAVSIIESVAKVKMQLSFSDEARIGDHQWWITDASKFKTDYPNWELKHDTNSIITEIHDYQKTMSSRG